MDYLHYDCKVVPMLQSSPQRELLASQTESQKFNSRLEVKSLEAHVTLTKPAQNKQRNERLICVCVCFFLKSVVTIETQQVALT